MPIPPLDLAGLGSTDVDELMSIDAVRLFAERGMSVRPDFRITSANARVVAELVRRLDGLPLAIELVASRLRLLPVEQIIDRLDARMLSSGSVDLPERHRTIQATISWSYELLTEPERRLFARFAVFRGGARLEDVERVCGPSEELGDDLIDTLSRLVDHSLIRRVDEDDQPRLRMLHVIREFAVERLEASGEAAEISHRHLETCTEYVESVAPELLRRDRKIWLDRLEPDHDNIRAALEWAITSAEPDLAFRLTAAAWRFWQARGYLHEARQRIEAVLALDGGTLEHRVKAVEALGGVLWWLSEMDRVVDVYARALEMQRELDDPKGIANALYNVALSVAFGENLNMAVAVAALDEAQAIYEGIGDVGGQGDIEWARGNLIGYTTEDLPGALEHFRRSIDYYLQAGNEFGMGWGLFEAGDISRRIGDFQQSWDYTSRGLSLFADHRDVSGVVLLLAAAAGLAKDLGDIERARRLAGAYHGLRITSGTEIVQSSINQRLGLEFDVLEALSGEEAIPYREGRAMDLDQAVAYALTGPGGA